MAGLNGISAYQQINRTIHPKNMGADRMGAPASTEADQASSIKENKSSGVETKGWSPIDPAEHFMMTQSIWLHSGLLW